MIQSTLLHNIHNSGSISKYLGIKMFKIISTVYSHLRKMAELNDDVTKMADILNLNENLLCIILFLILGYFEN